MKQQLVQQQTLQRKLNQTLIQSIQLLQFTSLELYEYINEIVKENPLIEEVVYDSDIQSAAYHASETAPIEAMNASELSIYDQLKEQLFSIDVPKDLLPVVEYGIYSLNEAGYLDTSLEEWAENCETSVAATEEALHIIQQLEPSGIGARSLGECIYLQLRHMDGYQEYMEDLLIHHLEWIADYQFETIEEEYGISPDELSELMKMIQACNPKPGNMLEQRDVEYIIPEAKIYKEEGAWKINFYNWGMPRLIISPHYKDIEEKKAKEFIRGKQEQLKWLEGAIKYRVATIEQVIRKIVEKQIDFFEHGVLELESMTLQDIADELRLHVSTISRAINNKYVETPHGIFPVKFFFQSGLHQGEEKKAAIAIKYMISQLIEREDRKRPLSDEKIKQLLKEEHHLQIARRTVMKYRQEMNIPSSFKRRKE